MFLRDIGTGRDTRKEWDIVPPPYLTLPRRRPPLARRVGNWIIATALLPVVLAGIILLIPSTVAMMLDSQLPDVRA